MKKERVDYARTVDQMHKRWEFGPADSSAHARIETGGVVGALEEHLLRLADLVDERLQGLLPLLYYLSQSCRATVVTICPQPPREPQYR